ncbi:hypothetical protein CRYUN_Cryun19dG0064900 [Craigia yunnanensis]
MLLHDPFCLAGCSSHNSLLPMRDIRPGRRDCGRGPYFLWNHWIALRFDCILDCGSLHTVLHIPHQT